jgi:hypothetical protein
VQAFDKVSLARDPITSLVFWIRSFNLWPEFALTLNSETPHKKIVKRVAVRGDGRLDLLHPHLRKPILESVLHPFAVLGRSAVLLEDVMVISSYVSASLDTILSYLF